MATHSAVGLSKTAKSFIWSHASELKPKDFVQTNPPKNVFVIRWPSVYISEGIKASDPISDAMNKVTKWV